MQGRLAAARERPDCLVLAGVLGDAVVGLAAVAEALAPPAERVGRIEVLYVAPPARGVGVGEALMTEVVSWCAARECTGIDARALPGNREAKNFFEAAGFSARLLIMHHRLTPGSPA